MLEYDNSAFYYFGITVSVIYLIPSVYYSSKRILFGCFLTDHLLDKHDVRCEKELQKIRQLQAEKTKLKNIFTWGFILNLVIIAIVSYSMFAMINLVKDNAEIKTFNPFEILGIMEGATDKEIKRAYRKMSLMYHPDKNPGDAVAESKFMMIAKAYEALTDEIAKANYEKYGNPDGRQALQLSIGLPTFLLDPDNHGVILFMYLLVLVLVIPSCVGLWYSHSKKFGDSMIMYDTYGFYNYALSEHAHLKMMPEILAGSAEFRELKSRPSDEKDLLSLVREFKSNPLVSKSKYNHPSIMKANMLLHAHLLRAELTEPLQADLNQMLKKAPQLIDGMLEISTMKCWLQTTINIIELSQYITQGLWYKDSSLRQLPNFTDAEVKHCHYGKNGVKTLDQFIRLDEENRKGMNNFSQEERDEVNRVCKILPKASFEVTAGVDDEEFIAEGDVMTISIKLTRENVVGDNNTCDLVYAPHFPFPKAERWIAILGDVRTNRIHGITKITGQDRVVEDKIMLQAPDKPGNYLLDLFIKSDSYLGLDQKVPVKFTVRPATDLPAFEVHPEDADLDNDPTLFQQVMSGAAADSSDSEDDDDDDNDDSDSDDDTLSEAQKKKREERLRRRKPNGDEPEEENDEDSKKNN